MTYDNDVEDSGSRTPLLGNPSNSRSSHDKKGDTKWSPLHILQFFGGGIYAPDPSTYDPLEILLNAEDPKEKDDLTIQWRDNKLSELSFVGVVSSVHRTLLSPLEEGLYSGHELHVICITQHHQTDTHKSALLAGVLTSTGSWPNILPNGKSSPWSVRTSWYCGIILSLFSILTAADQTVRLHRLSSHRDGLENIRDLLSMSNGEQKHSSKTGRRTPSMLQIWTWQMPVMFLTSGTICMIVGMFLHVWSATTHLDYPSLWDDNTKVAVVFSTVAVVSILLFFVGQVSLFAPLRR